MRKYLLSILAFSLLAAPFAVQAQTITRLEQWLNDGTYITQRIGSTPIKLTGYSDGCLGLVSGVLNSSGTACGSGSGSGGSSLWATSTTQNLTISPAGALAAVIGGTATTSDLNEQLGVLGTGNAGASSTGLYIAQKSVGTAANWNLWSGTLPSLTYDPYTQLKEAPNVFSFQGDLSAGRSGILDVLTQTGSTGNGGNSSALHVIAQTQGTGKANFLRGLLSETYVHGSGAVTAVIGNNAYIENIIGGSTVGNAIMFQANGAVVQNNGVDTNTTGLRILNDSVATGGSVGVQTGINIASLTTGGANHAIITGASGDVQFGYLAGTGTRIATASSAGLLGTTATISATNGGTGLDTSASTGIAQVSSGTWSVSSTLPDFTVVNSTTTTASFTNASTTKLVSASIFIPEKNVATSTSITINFPSDSQSNSTPELVRLGTSATTITLGNIIAGATLRITVCNPGTTAGALTWAPATKFLWGGGTLPTQTTTADKCDLWSFTGTNGTSTLKIWGALTTS